MIKKRVINTPVIFKMGDFINETEIDSTLISDWILIPIRIRNSESFMNCVFKRVYQAVSPSLPVRAKNKNGRYAEVYEFEGLERI